MEIRVIFLFLAFSPVIEWESNRVLPCRCNAIENDTIIVLCNKSHVKTTHRGYLSRNALLNQVVAHAFIHASLIVCRVKLKLHGRGVRVDREHIEKHVSLITSVLTDIELAGQESDLVACLSEGHNLCLGWITLVQEADVLLRAILGEADELHVHLIHLEGRDHVWIGRALDHQAAETYVSYHAWVVQVDLLCSDLGGVLSLFPCEDILDFGALEHLAVSVDVLVSR